LNSIPEASILPNTVVSPFSSISTTVLPLTSISKSPAGFKPSETISSPFVKTTSPLTVTVVTSNELTEGIVDLSCAKFLSDFYYGTYFKACLG